MKIENGQCKFPKNENTNIRERVIQIPPYAENTGLQGLRFDNKSGYPNLND